MQRKLRNIGVAVVAMVFAAVASALNVSAASVTVGSDGAGTTNGSATVPFSRTVSNVSNAVTNTFTYTITPDSANPTGATNLPTSAQVVFNAVAPVSGSATASSAVNFAGATFTTVGDYLFTIAETGSTDTTNYPLSTDTFTVLVSVRNVMSGQTPTGNLEVTLVQSMRDAGGTKTAGTATFTGGSNRTYIQLNSAVEGNNADTNRCFNYNVSIPVQAGVAAGDTYAINTSSTCSGTSAQASAGDTIVVSLRHGETATIGLNGSTNQLPIGVNYSVTLADALSDYSTYFDGSTTAGTASENKTTVAVGAPTYNTQNVTSVVHRKSSAVLTGIVTNLWFYLLLLAAGVAGVSYYVLRRNKAQENA